MTDPLLDPDLVDVWIVPGQKATYEVKDNRTFHVADPEAPLAILPNGTEMTWGGVVYDRILGSGQTIEGVWKNRADHDEWYFRRNGSYTAHWKPYEETFGIWALREAGASLWTREYRATVTTNGAEVTFALPYGAPAIYGYTVQNDIWTLMDRQTWAKLVEYHRV